MPKDPSPCSHTGADQFPATSCGGHMHETWPNLKGSGHMKYSGLLLGTDVQASASLRITKFQISKWNTDIKHHVYYLQKSFKEQTPFLPVPGLVGAYHIPRQSLRAVNDQSCKAVFQSTAAATVPWTLCAQPDQFKAYLMLSLRWC